MVQYMNLYTVGATYSEYLMSLNRFKINENNL